MTITERHRTLLDTREVLEDYAGLSDDLCEHKLADCLIAAINEIDVLISDIWHEYEKEEDDEVDDLD